MSRTRLVKERSKQRPIGKPIAEVTKASRHFVGVVFVVIAAITIVTTITVFLPWSHRLLTLRVLLMVAVMMGALLVALWHWRRSQDWSAP
jgi:uncharacterized integral membrane protein